MIHKKIILNVIFFAAAICMVNNIYSSREPNNQQNEVPGKLEEKLVALAIEPQQSKNSPQEIIMVHNTSGFLLDARIVHSCECHAAEAPSFSFIEKSKAFLVPACKVMPRKIEFMFMKMTVSRPIKAQTKSVTFRSLKDIKED